MRSTPLARRGRRPLQLLALIAGLACAPAYGQESRLVTTPPLGDALPLETTSAGVRLKFPVLLNAQTVIDPQALLRVVYVNPNAGLHVRSEAAGEVPHASGGFGQHHHSGDFSGGSANGATPSGDFGQDGAANKKMLSQEANAELWKEAGLFREALNAAADLGTTVVYSVPGQPKPLSAEINLPDGMLLGDIGNRIAVLALSSDSEAFQAGLQPQDEIRLLNGQPAPGSLEEFMRLYHAVTERARKAGQPYSFQVWRPAQSKMITLQIGAPPSLPSMF